MARDLEPLLSPAFENRRAQMFPSLGDADMQRLRRFGDEQPYRSGERLVSTGKVAPGLQLVLSGEVLVTPHDDVRPIVTHRVGSFLGELAQLSGGPSLVDATAQTPTRTLVIPSQRLRELLVEEAELGERIMRALILRRMALLERGIGGAIIVGRETNRDVLRLEDFLRRNAQPHRRLDPDTDGCAKTLVERFGVSPSDLPIVLCPNGELLRNPTENQLARCMGLLRLPDESAVFDVAIVGAGPAGLAAAVYAASEGLRAILLDCRALGGQAGASARIENYLGFPTGITGMALMGRAHAQALKFGAESVIPEQVLRLSEGMGTHGRQFTLRLEDGGTIAARSVVIASGAEYRRLKLHNVSEFEGSCVHYWASPLEARLCSGQEVVLVGGGNSAGQAAVYLAGVASRVWLLCRGDSLQLSMSQYLCERIAAQPNIEVLLDTEVIGLRGSAGELEEVSWRHRTSGATSERVIRHVFLFIGAEPNTSWLSGCDIALDAKGFVCADAITGDARLPFQTSRPGVFAIGDVRAGSIKRVAAAVGEGAQVVATLHSYLALSRDPLAAPGMTPAGGTERLEVARG